MRGPLNRRHLKIPMKNTPFARAFAVQSSSRNSSPAPDLVFFRLFGKVLVVIVCVVSLAHVRSVLWRCAVTGWVF